MLRVTALVGAVGLFALSSVAALAAPPVNESIKPLVTSQTNPCGAAQGGNVGNLQIVSRGKSGKGFQFQVKLTNGDPSNTYSIAMMQVQVVPQSVPPVLTCASLSSLGTLKTNSQGKGVKNVKYALAPGVTQSDLVLVLTDQTQQLNTTLQNLGTDQFTLVGP
jgi:hypothetical protein